MAEGDPDFVDPEEFQKRFHLGGGFNKDMLSFRFVCMSHILRLMQIGSREWRGGYWKESQIILNDGRILHNHTWEENTRQVYGNGVRMFYHLVEPKLWKINTKGEMEALPFSDKIHAAALKAKDYAKKLELEKEPTTELLNDYIEAHHDLFIWLNRYCEYNAYFSSMGFNQ